MIVKWIWSLCPPALVLFLGDTLVVDRWLWLRKNLPHTKNKERLLDVGCGSGALTMMAAHRGYVATGLSWDKQNNAKASSRALQFGLASSCRFVVFDVRNLDKLDAEHTSYDYVINTENIEHIIDDKKLIRDIYQRLKPGGFLLLTTPFLNYKPITANDNGPFSKIEDGGHVRRGYTSAMLAELMASSGFIIDEIEYCSGFASRWATRVMRWMLVGSVPPKLVALLMVPLRALSLMLEIVGLKGQGFSICLRAYKPRFSDFRAG